MNLTEIEEILVGVTEGPWAWESVAEKSNEFAVGIAVDKDGNAISGEIPQGFDEENNCFMDELIIRKSEIGFNEEGNANFADAAFIAASRTLIPELVKELRNAQNIISNIYDEIMRLEFFAMDIATAERIKEIKGFLERVKS